MPKCPPCPTPAACECDAYGAATEGFAFGHHHAKRYRTIVVDPPWQFDQAWATNGNPFLFYGVRGRKARGAVANYSVLTLADIEALPVGSWADDNAHLYLWTTNTFMGDGLRLAAAWGFKVKTILTWVKPRLGMGTYFRNNTEHVLFGVKGSLPVLRKDVRTAFEAEQHAHSEKPQAFYDMVETMSPGPWLDVFARKQRFGWDVFGNEVYTPQALIDTLTPEQAVGLTPAEPAPRQAVSPRRL